MRNIKRWAVLSVMALSTTFVALGSFASAQEYRMRVQQAPPPPLEEIIPDPPARESMVIPGHWEFVGNDYIWVDEKRVVLSSPEWIPGHWERSGEGWRWISGYWETNP